MFRQNRIYIAFYLVIVVLCLVAIDYLSGHKLLDVATRLVARIKAMV